MEINPCYGDLKAWLATGLGSGYSDQAWKGGEPSLCKEALNWAEHSGLAGVIWSNIETLCDTQYEIK